MKKLCFVCGEKKPCKLKSQVSFTRVVEVEVEVFCSVRCAADWGLYVAVSSDEDDIHWCNQHGWFTAWDVFRGCPDCHSTKLK